MIWSSLRTSNHFKLGSVLHVCRCSGHRGIKSLPCDQDRQSVAQRVSLGDREGAQALKSSCCGSAPPAEPQPGSGHCCPLLWGAGTEGMRDTNSSETWTWVLVFTTLTVCLKVSEAILAEQPVWSLFSSCLQYLSLPPTKLRSSDSVGNFPNSGWNTQPLIPNLPICQV